jgi:hypothetical protein
MRGTRSNAPAPGPPRVASRPSSSMLVYKGSKKVGYVRRSG